MCFNQIALFIYDFKAVYLAVSIILSNLKHVSIWSTWVFLLQWHRSCSHKWNLKVRFSWSKKLQINDVILLLHYKSFFISLISLLNTYLSVIDLLKVNNKHSRVSCAICRKLRIKTPEWRFSSSLFWCL